MSPVPNVLPRFSSRFTNGITSRAPELPVQLAQLKLVPDSETENGFALGHAVPNRLPVQRRGEWTYFAWDEAPRLRVWIADEAGLRAFEP